MGKPPPETVEALLTGRRRWTRQARVFDVVCEGIGATVRARTVDVSRGGLLAEAVDADVPPLHEGDLMPMAYLAAVAFAKGVTVTLAPNLTVRGDVVRVTTSPKERSFLRLGIRFRRPLTAAQCAVLRIDATDRSDPTFDPATEAPLPPDDEPAAPPPPSPLPAKAPTPVRIERERSFADRRAAPTPMRIERDRAFGDRTKPA
ncbi:MAG: PilZ domain-containing protein [Planctomycetia bacterium]|nr:PilZ domain-containing protein [Planctomycetia bacterium]